MITKDVKKFFLEQIQEIARIDNNPKSKSQDLFKALDLSQFIRKMLMCMKKSTTGKEQEVWDSVEHYLNTDGKIQDCSYCGKKLTETNDEHCIFTDPEHSDDCKYFCKKCVKNLKLDSIHDKNILIHDLKAGMRTKENFDACMGYVNVWEEPLIDVSKENKMKSCGWCGFKFYPEELITKKFIQGTFQYCRKCTEIVDKETKKDQIRKQKMLLDEENNFF